MLIYQKPSAVANSTINELFVFSNGQIKRHLIPRKTNTGPDFCCIFVFLCEAHHWYKWRLDLCKGGITAFLWCLRTEKKERLWDIRFARIWWLAAPHRVP